MCKFCLSDTNDFGIVEPAESMLAEYRAALQRGWSPDNIVDRSAADLEAIASNPREFIRSKSDAVNGDVLGRTFTLPDGTLVPRLPTKERWIWAGTFVGRIGLRYLSGTNELPASALGHIGYTIVPWKRGNGYAKRALAHILEEAREIGLTEVMITCDAINIPSQKVIQTNGGWLKEAFSTDQTGSKTKLRYFINLN